LCRCVPLLPCNYPRDPHVLLPGVGSLIGPIIGSALWRLTHRRTMALIDARDREFYQHIARNRVDPSSQSPTNPMPDFYGMLSLFTKYFEANSCFPGEKIGSLRQYRQVSHSIYFLPRSVRLIFFGSGSEIRQDTDVNPSCQKNEPSKDLH
jgi:Mitochondrial import protein Pam17